MHRFISLDPETLLSAYAQGAFPMADRDGEIRWYTADPRGIIPLDTFHVPHTLRSVVRRHSLECRINTSFEKVMRACAIQRRGGTWISDELVAAYVRLHRIGFAHSIETWKGDDLVGGLYGVTLGAAFFGESMFHTERDASKVALVNLVERLREKKFELLDAQASTPHLQRFGCIEIPVDEYLKRLRSCVPKQRDFAA